MSLASFLPAPTQLSQDQLGIGGEGESSEVPVHSTGVFSQRAPSVWLQKILGPSDPGGLC
uniref:Uncharacterized protein n=1 Tax=Anguilla anguilla TaxID=7936 RepID=A0A0E9T9J7_ANGAN